MWCVTRNDLQTFREEVVIALENGTIIPTGRDNFDPADRVIGPNMHTVNEQFIKPKTNLAGKMSWALMRNHDGLVCDVFISHAWIEGVFEFVDKVLYSWPYGCHAAYVCFLSNPQNLDISELVSDAMESPFAKALQSARYVMVVSNKTDSVYRRIWCVFEVYLAYKQNKTIFLAKPGRFKMYLATLPWQVVVFILGLASGVAVQVTGQSDVRLYFALHILFLLSVIPVWVMSLRLGMRLAHLFSFVGIGLSAFQLGAVAFAIANKNYAINSVGLAMASSNLMVALLSVWDVISLDKRERQRRELWKNYGGGVQNAQCSVQADKDLILRIVGSEYAAVERCVLVLLTSSMSTASIRLAREQHGITLPNFSGIRWMIVWMDFGTWLMLVVYMFPLWTAGVNLEGNACHDNDSGLCAKASSAGTPMLVGLALMMCWILVFLTVDGDDRRNFAIQAIMHGRTSMFWMPLVIVFLFTVATTEERLSLLMTAGIWTTNAVGLFTVVCSALNIDGILRIPCCGRYIVNFVWNIPFCCRRLQPRSDAQTGSSLSSLGESGHAEMIGHPRVQEDEEDISM